METKICRNSRMRENSISYEKEEGKKSLSLIGYLEDFFPFRLSVFKEKAF